MSLMRRRKSPAVRLADRYFGVGAEEARRLGHHHLGSEHILLALTRDRDSVAAKALDRLGVPRKAIEEEIQRAPLNQPPAGIDPTALATLGIDFDSVRERVEQTFGEGALEATRSGCMRVEPWLKQALAQAVAEAGDEPVDDEHMLLALTATERGAAARLLARRDISTTDVRRSLGRVHEARRGR